MSLSTLPLCLGTRGQTPTGPPPTVPSDDTIHSGTVPVNQIFSISEQAAKEFERLLKEDVRTFLLLKVPEDTGNLVWSYIYNFWIKDFLTQDVELLESGVEYAPFVEAAVGRNWQKGSAVDHAIEITRQHILEIYPRLLEVAFRMSGLNVEEIQHIGL